MSGWTLKDMPGQTGKLIIITGAGGLGFETALALAAAGATVIIAGRSPEKGAEALAKIKATHPSALVSFEALDLADLASIAAFAQRVAGSHDRLDLLINNAGIMGLPVRRETKDGFEMQLGTNHLGHFALTAHLMPLLKRGQASRIINVSSLAHRSGVMHFDDLQLKKAYSPWRAYSQSKLANLLFTFEFHRKSDLNGWGILAAAAHPGFSRTNIVVNGRGADSFAARLSPLLPTFISQSAAEGAWPTLYAATAPEVKPGGYYGPAGFMELKGPPKEAFVARHAQDKEAAARLWIVSEDLTGARFAIA